MLACVAMLVPVVLSFSFFLPEYNIIIIGVAALLSLVAGFLIFQNNRDSKKMNSQLSEAKTTIKAMQSKIASLGEAEFGIATSHEQDINTILKQITDIRHQKQKENKKLEKTRSTLEELRDIISRHSDYNDWQEWATIALTKIVRAVHANVAVWYFVDAKMREDGTLDLKLDAAPSKQAKVKPLTSYAFPKEVTDEMNFHLGEGFVGQTALDGDKIIINSKDSHQIIISSALGEAPAQGMAFIPLKTEDGIYGVLELGAITEFSEMSQEVLATISEPLAVVMKDRMRTQYTDRLREEERERADFEINSLNEMMNFYMESNRSENKSLKDKIKELESLLEQNKSSN